MTTSRSGRRSTRFTPGAAALALGALASGCAARGPALPMTRTAVAADDRATALVAYLGQPGADGSACGEDVAPDRVRRDPGLPAALVRALRAGEVPPTVFAQCAGHLLRALDRDGATALVDESLRAEVKLLALAELESSRSLAEQLAALHDVVALREPGTAASAALREKTCEALRERLASGRLGPVGREAAERLAAALDAERGRHAGEPVDGAALEALAAAGDEASLTLLARRLPDEHLRRDAGRRAVLLRATRSPFPEVRRAPEAAAAAALRAGVNPVSLDGGRAVEAWLDAARVPALRVRVRQDPADGTASLYSQDPSSPASALGVLPAVRLAGAVRARVPAVAGEVTMCERAWPPDPSPCLAPEDVTVDSPVARLRGAAIAWADEVPAPVAAELARAGGAVRAVVRVGGREAGAIAWPVVFERPADVVLSGAEPGGAGPALDVRLERPDADRLVYTIAGAGDVRVAVVERADAAGFRVVSRGARGAPGLSGAGGASGFDGAAGLDGSCPPFERWASSGAPGGAGGDGSPGSPGGRGGRGGDVSVTVVAPPELREDTLALARLTVSSPGGPGGEGGRGGDGGSGGDGGRGGSGTTCFVDDRASSIAGGADGPDGPDGVRGPDGADGPPGRPGTVSVQLAEP